MRGRILQRHWNLVARAAGRVRRDQFERDLICVDITPAAQWFYEESGQEYWDWEQEFPSVVPPWPLCWLEFSGTRIIADTTGAVIVDPKRGSGVGVLAMTFGIRHGEEQETLLADHLAHLCASLGMASSANGAAVRKRFVEEYAAKEKWPRWIVRFQSFFEIDGKIGRAADCFLYCDRLGSPLSKLLAGAANPALQRAFGDDWQHYVQAPLMPFLFALSLSHCKNVYLTDANPILPRSRKARKQGYKAIKYKTLVITPFRKQIRREGKQTNADSVKHALHIVRGHFKDYRNGDGLFGKYQDIYWWDMHVRGNVEQGIIKKDYIVKQRQVL